MIEIIPAIDIIDGKCVRLTQGDYAQKKVYSDSPADVAKMFEDNGIRRIHIVDLDGARLGKVANLHKLYQIAITTSLIIDYGGGIKTEEDVKSVFENGAAMINVGSIAVKEPATLITWGEVYGWNKILLGADVKEDKIAINGWQQDTEIAVTEHIATFYAQGMRQLFCTDIAMDGMLQGPSLDLYKKILATYPTLQLTASGGVSNTNDIEELAAIGCTGVIIGKALYEGKITMNDLKKYVAHAY